jgi:hypothetical protein
MAVALEEEQKPLEMLLVLRELKPPGLTTKATRAPLSRRERLKGRSDRALLSDAEETDHAAQEPPAAGGMAPAEDKILPPQPPATVQQVIDTITMLGGQVITPEGTWQKEKERVITARIPAKNYSALVESLLSIGTLQSPVPMPSHRDEGPLQVHIKVLPE